ncbi:FKBP-type peptidyl-prolyl cis-trans isomerase [Candidatus Saccharibacteria bacterium]|nr:FKBP-type peptidyl-prolyl cis-trans isomerase [Candidatus Saccharibacteria bacterium]
MDQKALKTTWQQRVIIIVIALLLLGSTIATYIGIILSNNNGKKSTSDLEDQYTAKLAELNAYGATLSKQYFDTFSGFRSRVKAYNAESANSTGVKTTDLKVGDGRELATGDLEYYAYYIGWCPDESVFDSSFDDFEKPTQLKTPIYAGQGLIEGWNTGVVGMKIGGVREIQMPGELAYGSSREICGTTNSPLKFVVMAIEDEKLNQLNDELDNVYAELVGKYYDSSSTTSN